MAGSCYRHGFLLIIFSIILLICCSFSAAADEDYLIYSVRADTAPVRSTGTWSAYDYGAVTDGGYSSVTIYTNEDFWLYTNHSVARGFANLWNKLDNIKSDTLSINSYCGSINSSLSSILTNSNSIPAIVSKLWGGSTGTKSVYYLDSSGNISSSSVGSVGDILSYSSINSLYAGFWAKENNDALWSIAGGLNTVNTNLGTINSSIGTVDSDLNTLTSKVFDTSVPTENFGYYHYYDGNYNSVVNPTFLAVTANGYRAATSSEVGSVTSLADYLDLISRDLLAQGNMLFNFSRTYTQSRYNLSTHSSSSSTIRSLADSLTYGFSDLSNFTGRLASIFASDDDIQAREDADPQIQQAQDDFISPDGAASVKLRDMGSAKDVSASIQSSLDTGVSPSTSFSYFSSNSSLFSFFSDDCRYNLDSVPATRSSEEFLDFYTPNFRQIGVAFDD